MAPRRRRHEETGLKVARRPTYMSRADPLSLFFFTGRSRVKGRRGAPMLLALCDIVAQASCRLQSEAPRAVVRGTFICGTTRNYKHIKHSFICERVLKVCSGILDIVYVYCAVMVFKIESI